ncbi:right-handed parallel beta-helix repeat-containing protein [Microbacterium sp. No. 7]|uniref:right-handed parallel beta-helix repeat-containing protein n=1 Tax=Microbacterium sp. No. 7 TaxID=1714373 RepID=UPI0006ECD891|nr:right-handed parallel beta-helix repeat-containing protein [Microbacterium sp. No. 7]ALJ21360.1 hypothetical protein AOA12_16200 [Microbacterium sp. No. 7]
MASGICHRRVRLSRSLALTAALAVLVSSGCSSAPGGASGDEPGGGSALVRVPEDASLADAGTLVADGGVILISPGLYHESLEVRADDVTVRGLDRNGVVIDGELTRQNGVVATGERIAVENLTVRNHLQNGVLITGVTDESGAGVARGPDGYLPEAAPPPVPGYLVQHVTATNNGLYGIYAFNRTGGAIRQNLASGGSDSGIYIGQCASCGALVEGNVLVSNAVGLEFANASDVIVTGNRIVGNRIGVSVLSNYLEAHGPSRGVQVVGNVISGNNEERTPEQAGGAFGVGIGLSGTVDAVVSANRIEGNTTAGVWITSSEDFAPAGNTVEDNSLAGNRRDVVFAPAREAAGGSNCFRLQPGTLTEPVGLPAEGCATEIGVFSPPTAPPGIVFSRVPFPSERAGLAEVDESPRIVPDAIALPSVAEITVPDADLLDDE